jgi:hypothetical protein
MDAKFEFEVDVDVEGPADMMDRGRGEERDTVVGDGWMIRRGDR